MTGQFNQHEPSATLLVVDDDTVLRTLLANSLGEAGYKVFTACNALDMKRVLALHPVDVVILDIMMPGEDGLSACKRLDARGGPPVILLSALGEEEHRILGLDSGADRYLPKPCSSRELHAHVRSILKRQRSEDVAGCFLFAGFRLNLDTRELFNAKGALIALSEGEFAVLRVFVERPRRVISRNDLLLAARGPDSEAYDRAIDVQVSRLRRKMRLGEDDALIRTVRNEGYMFVPKVTSSRMARATSQNVDDGETL